MQPCTTGIFIFQPAFRQEAEEQQERRQRDVAKVKQLEQHGTDAAVGDGSGKESVSGGVKSGAGGLKKG